MNEALRPMRLGEILDRTFQIYRERFSRFVCIAAAPAAFMAALHFADLYWWHLGQRGQPPGRWAIFVWGLAQSLVYHHAAVIVYALFTPVIVCQTSAAVFKEPASLKDSFRFSFGRWRSFLGIGLLLLAIVLLGAEAAAFGVLAAMGSSMDALGLLNDNSTGYFVVLIVIPLLGGIVLFFWLTACCAFLVPVCAFENVCGFKSVRRSWKLSREGRWRIAFTWLMLFLFSWVLLIRLQMLFRWAVILLYRAWPASWHLVRAAYTPASFAIQAILAIIVRPLYDIAATLFYYDQRIRKEGFDVEWMMQSAGMTEIASVPTASAESAAPEAASVPVEEAGA
jgi:hypothetical protein